MVSEIFVAVELRDCSSVSVSALFSRLVLSMSETTVLASDMSRCADKDAVSTRMYLADRALGLEDFRDDKGFSLDVDPNDRVYSCLALKSDELLKSASFNELVYATLMVLD